MPVLLGSGVLVIILIFVIIYLLSHASASNPVVKMGGIVIQNAGDAPGKSLLATPNFCGTPLSGNIVIYLLDCGNASKDYIGDLKEATIKSAGSLTADRRFAILFWNNAKDGAYPDNTTAYATKDSIASAEKAIDDIAGFGQTDITPSLKLALAQHPDEIVIATGKGSDLENAWLDNVLTLRGNLPVKIDTFNLVNAGAEAESAPLKNLASQTGGIYRELTKADLRALAQ